MKTFENIYCRPQNEAEWRLLGYDGIPNFAVNGERAFYCYKGIEGNNVISIFLLSEIARFDWLTTEIPVQHFIDLAEDNICAWRLEENNLNGWTYIRREDGSIKWELWVTHGYVELQGKDMNIKTFTDLLTLIKFLK